MINIICDVSADKLTTASDECHVVNNSYCYSTLVCLNSCKLYHLIMYIHLHLLLKL